MTNIIEKLKVKKRLQTMFPIDSAAATTYQQYAESEYLELLEAVRRHMPHTAANPDFSLVQFLYAGCLKFDRFTVPTPFVVDRFQSQNFIRFLQALVQAENGNPTNTAVFMLREIRGRMYREFDAKSIHSIPKVVVENYRHQIAVVTEPDHPTKRQEFLEEKQKCLSILDGVTDGSFRTTIKTRIPFVLHLSPLLLTFSWANIPMMLSATPKFVSSGETSFNVIPASHQTGPSRWQASYTEIEIQIESLIDCDAFVEPIQALHQQEFPVTGWPKCFVTSFHIVRDVSWRLRFDHQGEKNWIPAPRDLSDIQWAMSSSGHHQIEWKLKGSPANLMRGFTPSTERLNLQLGKLETPKWSDQCQSLSVMYFEMGQREESLFWLNVGVESLFEERFSEIAKVAGKPSLESDLVSPKAFWTLAEGVVANQFPDLAGKISWPTDEIHVSVYAKLKYLYKTINMKTSYKELLTHYSKIQRKRNDLFHGRKGVAVTIRDIQDAIESFAWIQVNFEIAAPAKVA